MAVDYSQHERRRKGGINRVPSPLQSVQGRFGCQRMAGDNHSPIAFGARRLHQWRDGQQQREPRHGSKPLRQTDAYCFHPVPTIHQRPANRTL